SPWPPPRAPPPSPTRRSSDLLEGLPVPQRRQLHPAEHGVAHQDSEGALVGRDRPDRLRAEGQLLSVGLGAGAGELLPFVEQARRSEEHTSELQSRENLVCRLL